jgi:hypothetical protein
MTAIPATALGEIRLDLNDLLLNGTDAGVGGYAYVWPNLAPGTIYRASNVDPLVAKKHRVTFSAAGLVQDPATGAYPLVLASNAPGASYAGMQWVLGDFHLTGLTSQQQPADRYFEVPAQSFVNVGLIVDPAQQPAVRTIYVDTAPILTALNTTDSAVANLVNTSSSTRTALDTRYVQPAVTDSLDTRVDTLEAGTSHTTVRNRFCTVTNSFTATTFADFTGADATALAMTFTKTRAATKLVVNLTGVCELTTGVVQNGHLGISVNGVDYEVGRARFPAGASNNRRTITGVIEITGVAAGTFTVKPRFRATASSSTFGFYADDMVSYSITETL